MSEIILEHIQKQYDGKPVLNDLSLTIRSCERVSVICFALAYSYPWFEYPPDRCKRGLDPARSIR